jgi:hypothetical protein
MLYFCNRFFDRSIDRFFDELYYNICVSNLTSYIDFNYDLPYKNKLYTFVGDYYLHSLDHSRFHVEKLPIIQKFARLYPGYSIKYIDLIKCYEITGKKGTCNLQFRVHFEIPNSL